MPPNTKDTNFRQNYKRDLYKLVNTYDCHVRNQICYKNDKDTINKLCRYGYPHKVVTRTHFDDSIDSLHIKRTDQWINNANPIVMVYCQYSHDLKFIGACDKDAKALVYFITNYITKSTIYTSHMYLLLQIAVRKIESTYFESFFAEHLARSC